MVYDLIIVGGGPAGITAGIFGARKKLKTLLISKDFLGQAGLASLIENYPGIEEISGIELSQRFKKHLKKFSLLIKKETVTEIKKRKKEFTIYTKNKKIYSAKAIIIASGRKPGFLNIPGEKRLIGKGVSFCSTCDAPFFQNKIVAVIGAGNTAFGAVLDLEKYAKKIFIFQRSSQIKADEILWERVKKLKKVKIFFNSKIKEIKGDKNVESIIVQNTLSQKIFEIPVQGVFIHIKPIPVVDFVKNLVNLNKSREIIINFLNNKTNVSGCFAAGDVTNIKYKQIIIATGEGAKAALSAYKYLEKLKVKN